VVFTPKGTSPPKASSGQEALAAFLGANNQGIPLNQPLVDGFRLGSFWVRVGVTIEATATNVAHGLGRQPSAFIVVNLDSANTIFATAGDSTLWSPTNITLRSSPGAAVTSLLIG
jgi:hypothetical protein